MAAHGRSPPASAAASATRWGVRPSGGRGPLPPAAGGLAGDGGVRRPAVIFGPPGFLYRLVLGSILFAAAIATFLIASGIGSATEAETTDTDDDAPFEQEDDD